MEKMSVDIETYSDVDLIKCGVYPYTQSPEFEIMLIAYKIGTQPVKLIDLVSVPLLDGMLERPTGNIDEFLTFLKNPNVIKKAYNAAFDRTCLARYFKCTVPAEEWRCTMIHAASLGLPGSLGAVGEVLGLDKKKLTEGKELISYFCKPDNQGTRHLPEHSPDKWERFCNYCIRDVEAESEIGDRLSVFPLIAKEQTAWVLDQKINDRGIHIDPVLVDNAIQLSDRYNGQLTKELKGLTGLDNPNSPAQLKRWLQDRGMEVPSLDKKTVPELIKQAPDAKTKRVLEIRREASKTSVKKYEAMKRGLCKDEKVRSTLRFYGANRTGRWSGQLVQTQNLPQNKLPDIGVAREILRNGEFELLELAYGAPPFVLSQLIRTAFVPSNGRKFVIADYSAIEARVLAWLAGEKWVIDVFKGDGLIYEATASMMFHVPKDEIKKGGRHADLRPKGKTAVLACGYQGNVDALKRMGALESGIPESELPEIVEKWRKSNGHIVKYWRDVEAAAIGAVRGRKTSLAHGVTFFCRGGYLFIQLPSGRRLAYYQPKIEPDPKFNKQGITYMGVEKSKWSKRRTYGGMLVENITQAVARDCLRDAMLTLDSEGYEICMHVHDEVVIDDPTGGKALDPVLEIMGRPMKWAPGLPLRAAGFSADFYMKD